MNLVSRVGMLADFMFQEDTGNQRNMWKIIEVKCQCICSLVQSEACYILSNMTMYVKMGHPVPLYRNFFGWQHCILIQCQERQLDRAP